MNLTKTILILFSIIFYAACSLFAQDKVIDEKLYEKENGKWFLHENNRKFKVLPRTQAPARACLVVRGFQTTRVPPSRSLATK